MAKITHGYMVRPHATNKYGNEACKIQLKKIK